MRTLTSIMMTISLLGGTALVAGCGSAAEPTNPSEPNSVNTESQDDDVADLAEPEVVKATYSCTSPSLGTISVDVTLKGKTPASVAATAKVDMKKFQAAATISAADVNELMLFGSSLSGSVSTMDITATDAKKATVNAAKSGITIPSTPLVKGEALTLHIPTKVERVGSWSPSAAGTMTFSGGALDMTITVGTETATATCKPSGSAVISTTTVK